MAETRRGVLWVTSASVADMAISFLTPILLARLVPVAQFGEYRFFWLVVMTLVAFAPLGLEQALVYFLYRVPSQRRIHVVGNTLLYFHLVAIVGFVMVAPWNAFIADRLGFQDQMLLAGFCLLYLTSLPLDYLPLANEHPGVHAGNVVATAVVRVASVILPVLITRDITSAFYGLLLFSCVRLALLAVYTRSQYQRLTFPFDFDLLVRQFGYGVPFGLSGALYTFRSQGEQWLVAGVYPLQDFAVFSVGFLVVPLMQVLQQPVARLMQPRIHSLAAEGKLERAHELNRRVNVSVGFVTYPLIGFSFVFAEPMVECLLPAGYGAAANVVRMCLIGQFRLAHEGSSLLQVTGDGRYAMRLTGMLLVPSLLVSTWGALYGGLAAAAAGSVMAGLVEVILVQRRLTARLGVRFSAIQDWSTHARLLAMAIAANAMAFTVGRLLLSGTLPLLFLLATALTMAATYVLLSVPMGLLDLAKAILVLWRRPRTS